MTIGANGNTPQTTEQHKFQFRDDFSWRKAGWGLGHDMKAGVNFINEPRLFITFNSAKGIPQFTHNTNDPTGPISTASLNDGDSHANMPLKQFGTYFQDDWRITGGLTLNLGLRYDLMTGYQLDQSKDPNFVALQTAGKSGRLAGMIGFEDFGKDPQEDHNNIQPRIGMAWDVRKNAADVVRAGWGIYTDVGYSNSNILFGAADASGLGFGPVFTATNPNGLRNPDGSFYRVGQPLTNLASLNEVLPGAAPLFGFGPISPRLQQPESWQTNVGWTHQLDLATVFNADYVHIDGKNLNIRPRLNTRPNGGARRLADLPLSPNNLSLRPAISRGKSQYDAMILSVRRRMHAGFDFTGSYTLGKALSNIGDSSDALDASLIQDAFNPFDDPKVFGPNRLTDARHRVTLSAVWQAPWGFQVAPIYIFRSALPVATTQDSISTTTSRTTRSRIARLPTTPMIRPNRRTSGPAKPGNAAAAIGSSSSTSVSRMGSRSAVRCESRRSADLQPVQQRESGWIRDASFQRVHRRTRCERYVHAAHHVRGRLPSA